MGKPQFKPQLEVFVFEEQEAQKLPLAKLALHRLDEVAEVIVEVGFFAEMPNSTDFRHFMLIKIALRKHFADRLVIVECMNRRQQQHAENLHLDSITSKVERRLRVSCAIS